LREWSRIGRRSGLPAYQQFGFGQRLVPVGRGDDAYDNLMTMVPGIGNSTAPNVDK
jgi:hypothetical protein